MQPLRLLIMTGLLAAGSAFAQSTPDPTQINIQRLTYAGPGCPTGSVAHNLAPDAKAFTVLFDSFLAEAGPGIPPGRNKTSCRVTIDLRFPNGWSYSLFTVDYRGYMALDSGVTATQKSSYYFQAAPGVAAVFSRVYAGPVDDDVSVRDTMALTDVNWSPCGRTRAMNIDTEIKVSNVAAPSRSGLLTIDSMDGQVEQTYGIAWQRCP